MKGVLKRPDVSAGHAPAPLARGIIVNAGALVVQGGLRLLFVISAARLLGPESYAEFALMLALAAIVSIAWPASAGSAFIKFVVRERDNGAAPGVARHLLRQELQFDGVVALVLGIGLSLAGWSVLSVVAAVLLAWGLSSQGFGRGVHLAVGMRAREALMQVSAGCLALLLAGVYVALPGNPSAGGFAIALGLAFVVYGVVSWPRTKPGHASGVLKREMDRFVAVAVIGSFASAGLAQVSVAVANARLEATAAGEFSVAVSLSLPFGLVASAILLALFPRFAGMALADSRARIAALRWRVWLLVSALLVPGAAVASLLAPWLIPLVVGAEYPRAPGTFVILLLGVTFTGMASMSVAVLSSASNAAAVRGSLSAWVGLLGACGVWLFLGKDPESIALGYTFGCWLTATLLTSFADRLVDARLTLPWFGVSVALAAGILGFAPGLNDRVLTVSWAAWGMVLGGTCVVGAILIERLGRTRAAHG